MVFTPAASKMIRIGRSLVGRMRDFLHAEMRTIEVTALAARITSFNANVPDWVFIAPAGLTLRILIGKHKVKGAGQHSSDAAARPVRAHLDVVTRALRLNAQ